MNELSKPKGTAKYTPPPVLHWRCSPWLLGGRAAQTVGFEIYRDAAEKAWFNKSSKISYNFLGSGVHGGGSLNLVMKNDM